MDVFEGYLRPGPSQTVVARKVLRRGAPATVFRRGAPATGATRDAGIWVRFEIYYYMRNTTTYINENCYYTRNMILDALLLFFFTFTPLCTVHSVHRPLQLCTGQRKCNSITVVLPQ